MLTTEQRLNLAVQHHHAGRLSESEAEYREVLRESPRQPHALYLLGNLLQQLGKHREAIDLIKEALAVHGPHPTMHGNLATSYVAVGQLSEALSHWREAARLAPGNAQFHNQLGWTLLALDRPQEAAASLREAVRLLPYSTQALNNLGVVLRELNEGDAAIDCFAKALRLEPASTPAHHNLGHTLESQGRITEAISEYEKVLQIAPNDIAALTSLGRLAADGFYRFEIEQVRRVQELFSRPGLSSDDQRRLHQILAWVLDKSGEFDQAFSHCKKARELRKESDRRHGIVFDRAAHSRFIDRIRSVFSPSWFERASSFGWASDLPIFVVGMMRSGTSLVEQILASHPRVYGAGELPDVDRMLRSLPQRLGTTDEYPECLSHLDAPTARMLAEEYLEKLRKVGGPASRVVDKMPFNYLRMGFLAALFPRARFIHCVRDPLDTCLSCYFQDFSAAHPFTLDLNDLGCYYRDYERLMAHWESVVKVPVFILVYEDLTADLEGVCRRLLEFCGLEWDDRCLRYNETRRMVHTTSAAQVRREVYRSSVGKWQRYQAHLQPLFEALACKKTTEERR